MTYHTQAQTHYKVSISSEKALRGKQGIISNTLKNVIHNSAVIFMNLYATNNITWNKTNNENKTNTETEGKIYL